MDVPLLLRDTRADFWQAADRDLGVEAYLTAASCACSAFVDSGALHNRHEIKCALNVFMATGQFGLFLDGKNVGKSLLLTDLSRATFTGVDGVYT